MNVEDTLNRSPIDRTRGIIEKSIDDLQSILTVFSLVAFEKLEPEEMQAVARGGFEMAGRLQRDLEHVLPHYPATGHEGDRIEPEAAAEEVDSGPSVIDRLASSTRVSDALQQD